MGGATFVNCLPHILPVLEEEGYYIDIEDSRESHDFKFDLVTEDLFHSRTWPARHPSAGEPIVLRDYQVEVINQFLQTPHCLQEIATGAGKTLITAALSYMCEPYGRTIVIVPNKDLVTQTETDYVNLGLDVGVYYGDRKELGKTHTICTWQSLNVLEKRFRDGLSDNGLHDFAEGVVCVMVDEVHQAKADVLKKLLTGPFANVPIRWGLTGTIPKADHERLSLEISLGEVINKLAANELQDMGVLANCDVNIIQLQDTVSYGDYQSELTYLTTNKNRLDYLATIIQRFSESGNTLVLVDRIKAGEGLVERLGEDTVFVSGSMKSKNRKEEIEICASILNKRKGSFIFHENEDIRKTEIKKLNLDVFICGWSRYEIESYVSKTTLVVMIYHGIGVKPSYWRDNNKRLDLRFVEGQYRIDQLRKHGVDTDLVLTGYIKLDSLFNKNTNYYKKKITQQTS